MSIRNEEKLRELQEWQKANGVNVDRVFFTTDGDLQYFPFCADFGLCLLRRVPECLNPKPNV